jgi:hypothetical protein
MSILTSRSGHRIRYNRGGTDREFECVVLVRSSHWYSYRLNVFGIDIIELVVCGRHDSCLPIPVWSVEETKIYNPLETARPLDDLSKPEVRGTRYGHALLVAAILSGKQEALELLEQLPRSMRYRVQAEVRAYANLKRGRKLKIV